jgi:uncharacterized membrane protein YhaH (DUF805 family)
MNFGQAIASGFQNYVNFQGRSSRSAFWFWALFSFIVSFAFSTLSGGDSNNFFGLLGSLAGLAMLLPGLAVAVRRLHDIDRSGWFILLGLIPIVGIIILIVYYCQPSTVGANRFGSAAA